MSSTPEDGHGGSTVDKVTDEEAYGDDALAPPALTPEQEKQLWRKLDLRLMPILSVMYLLAFMDRGTSWTSLATRCLVEMIASLMSLSLARQHR